MLDRDDIHPLFAGAPGTTSSTSFATDRAVAREAIKPSAWSRPGDRWLVCLSGGKDGYTLLAGLTELQWRGLLPVDLLACNLDQGQPGFPARCARVPGPHEGGAPDRVRGHLFGRQGQVRGGRTSARSARGSGAGPLRDRARGGVGGPWCSATTATTSSRPSSRTSFEGRLTAMPPKLLNDEARCPGTAAARAGRRGRLRALRPRDGLSDDPLRSLRDPGRAAARAGGGRCSRARRAGVPSSAQMLFRALGSAGPRHLLDTALFDFKRL